MPLSRMKPIQAFVVTCCVAAAMPLVASAQLGGRLWTPMTDLEKPQAAQGLYASLEALYWSVTPLQDYDIGYRNPDGSRASREVYSGYKAVLQHNTLDTSSLANNFTLGMRLEIGNTNDHHGWLISGYGLPGQSSSFTSTGGPGERFEMVINDLVSNATVLGNTGGHPGNTGNDVYQASLWWNPSGIYDQYEGYYEGSNGQPYTPVRSGDLFSGIVGLPYSSYPYTSASAPLLFTVPAPVGFLWGWVPITNGTITDSHITDPTPDDDGEVTTESRTHAYYTYGIAPLPVTFDSVSVNSKADNWSLEAMYTYRVHPTRLGNLDVLGGLRYWHLEDEFSVAASGTQTYATTTGTMPASVLSALTIDSTAVNRIVGPQIGLRYSKTANRYTGMLEGRFFAGVNTATLRNSGTIASYMNALGTDPTNPIALGTINGIGQAYAGVPLGLVGGANTYNYRRTKQLFSPGFELRANTHFQLTRQVGLQIGFSSMWVDQVVRGAAVNDYTVKSNGKFFGIRDDKQSRSGVLVYGATVGIVCNRF